METVKIRCKDLMVGDWVANRNGSPMQIVAVDEDNAYACEGNEAYACEGNEEHPWIFGDDEGYEPQPIEITEDILKENKWEVRGYTLLPDEHYCVIYLDKYILLWSPRVLSIWFDNESYNNGVIADIIVPCKYVHQLQKVLRLAGMTDMANNFKI